MFKIGLLGVGTVGSGVYEIINEEKGAFPHSDELKIEKALVRDLNKKRKTAIPAELLTDNADDIINNDEINMVIAVMGGMEPELSYIERSLKKGKHVVTANKEIMAEHMERLLNLARINGVHILFEASVGGGIPIINSVIQTLKINKIDKIQGILNGTTNFIVSKMTNEKKDFNEILKLAQDMGFAEADPTADVEGFDIARKIGVLATLCFGKKVGTDVIYRRGIRNITLDDITMALSMGYKFKYLAEAQTEDGLYSASVAPILLNKNSMVANVNEEYNVVTINGNIIGQLSFMGKGAGKDATANAVVADVIQILNNAVDLSHLTFDNDITCCGISNYKGRFYLRVSVSSSEQFTKVIDMLYKNLQSHNILYQNGKIFLMTEEKSGSSMHQLASKLAKISDDVFYARVLDNIL